MRIVWGTGTGPTDVASYDAALADAGVHNYNIVTVSSIVPTGAVVESVGTAPDLGPPGNRLTAVQARATVAGPDRATAGLGWATGDGRDAPRGEGPGVIYEASGEFGEETARERIRRGIDAATELRDWPLAEPELRIASTTVDAGTFATAVALAVFGESEPII